MYNSLSGLLPEALRTKCIRCTERQKKTAVKIITRLKYEYPEEWAKLSTRWDPTGDFTRYFEEFLAKEQFNSIPGSGEFRTYNLRASCNPSFRRSGMAKWGYWGCNIIFYPAARP